jgi:hypothetical protein
MESSEPLQATEKLIQGRKKCQGTILQAAEKPLRGSKKCQGTTSVVPQMQQKKERALAPERCFLEFQHGIKPFSAACLAVP